MSRTPISGGLVYNPYTEEAAKDAQLLEDLKERLIPIVRPYIQHWAQQQMLALKDDESVKAMVVCAARHYPGLVRCWDEIDWAYCTVDVVERYARSTAAILASEWMTHLVALRKNVDVRLTEDLLQVHSSACLANVRRSLEWLYDVDERTVTAWLRAFGTKAFESASTCTLPFGITITKTASGYTYHRSN